jgi:hypothetical protein
VTLSIVAGVVAFVAFLLGAAVGYWLAMRRLDPWGGE